MKHFTKLILLILFVTCSNKQKLKSESMIFLGSPIIKTLDRDLPSELSQIRIIAIANSSEILNEQISNIELLYYRNLNRFLLPNEEQKNRIIQYLNLDSTKSNEWFLNWNNEMTKDELKIAKEVIGINFCQKIPKTKLSNGFYPILNLKYFEKLGEYNYVSDILEAYELENLFQVKSFTNEFEALAWGLFQIQAIRMQYAHFEYALQDDYEYKLPELTTDYIGGMSNETLEKHFRDFLNKNKEILNTEKIKDIVKVVKN